MSAPQTIRIFSPSPTPLDGSTPFDKNAATKTYDETTGITGYFSPTPFGVLDLADLFDNFSQSLVVNAISVENSLARHSKGSVIQQISPNRVGGSSGNRRTVVDMGNTAGSFNQLNEVFPIDHRLAINTQADGLFAGSHTIQITVSPVSGSAFLNNQKANEENTEVLSWKNPVRVASTANIDLSSLIPGSTVDDVTVASGDRVLLKDQTNSAENGLYEVQEGNEPAVRVADASNEQELFTGLAVAVNEGTNNNNTAWVLATPAPIVLGTTALTFAGLGSGGGGGGGETYAQTLALGQDSGGLGPYLNSPQRRVNGSTVSFSPSPGSFNNQAEGYQYEGSHQSVLVAGGGEGSGTYLTDTTDILIQNNGSLFTSFAIVEWGAWVYSRPDGSTPTILTRVGGGKEVWSVGNSGSSFVQAMQTPYATDFAGNPGVRLAQGSINRSLALEILDGALAASNMIVRAFYKVTFCNNVNSF